ncbi:hypothetical protein FIBSPDRAFT_256408 [Athelia psychrophila]|uniref:Uncharacterized protein n=1 Tax=Athelia psychrophila TaxID=1759441 RepID=A0A165XME3_9AGAM|nr:hypothetical protein FIBSPDRAFT_256408 [Fibularhizoctonia sp. CBS 109695]
MASTASTSARPVQGEAISNSRPGPLPLKLGEIGYREPDEDLERGRVEGHESDESLPARHPADQDLATTEVPLTPAPVASEQTDDSVSTRPSMRKRLGSKQYKFLGGITLHTFALFVTQLLALGGTIAAWVLSIKIFNNMAKHSSMPDSAGSGSVFIYVIFVLLGLIEFIFLDRQFYHLRAERYSFLHPGEILPTHNHSGFGMSMGMAPWHRPPLPTYAAALTQGGPRGTGDVEDAAIAVPPPPAYGHTRDSRLLLQGYLRSSLRAQRPVSEHSQMSEREGERPLSYASQDPGWREIQDAERAIQLESALTKLESDAPQGPTRASIGEAGPSALPPRRSSGSDQVSIV